MFGDPDLEFGRDGAASSPNDDSASSYHLGTSASFGFSIHDAIKELSLEEDGDPRTFLHKSTALLSNAPSSSTTPTPIRTTPYHHLDTPSSAPLDLKTVTRTPNRTTFRFWVERPLLQLLLCTIASPSRCVYANWTLRQSFMLSIGPLVITTV